MARLWTCGSELNSTSANVEYTSANGTGVSISSSVSRSGTYGLRSNGLTSGSGSGATYQFAAANNTGPFYFRAYFYVVTLPTATNRFIRIQDSSNNSRIGLGISSAGQLILGDEDSASIATGPTLSANAWYMIEIKIDLTGAGGTHIIQAKVNGGQLFGATNRNISTGVTAIRFGGNLASTPESQTQGDWYFDDMAINDNAGSFQNTWCGPGKVVYLRPNAAGDANSFATQIGGTAGSANNYTRVNEVTPDDATSYNASLVLNQEDLFNCDASGINAADKVNVVAIGARFADLVAADATSGLKFEVMKASGGTKSQSANTVPNTTTWSSNASAVPRASPLTLYQDPDSAAWTKATLDSMQIGYTLDAVSVRAVGVSNIWAIVDYTPASGGFLQMF